MSKVPYTIDVNDYICTELERMRKMCQTLDFSALPAHIERIQYHASRMEEALYTNGDIKRWVKFQIDNKEMDDTKFREALKEQLEKSNE